MHWYLSKTPLGFLVVYLLLLVSGCACPYQFECPSDSHVACQCGNRVNPAVGRVADMDTTPPVKFVSYTEDIVNPLEREKTVADSMRFEDDASWTLETVLQFALRHQPVLLARQCEVKAARARLLGAGLLTNPHLVIDSDAPTHGGPTELRGRIMFEIPHPAKRRARRAVACAGVQRARLALSREAENVLVEAADAAVEVLYLQDLLELRQKISRLAAKKSEIMEPDLDRQTAKLDISDRLKTDLAAANREAELLDAENRLQVASLRLSRAIGLKPSPDLRMEGHLDIDSMPLEPLETTLAKSHKAALRIDEASAALTESRQLYRLAWAEAVPAAELGPRYGDELGTADKQVGARFETYLPVFDWNQDEIWRRGAEVQANHALLNAAKAATCNDIASACAELESLRKSINGLETGAMKRLSHYEHLLRDSNARKGITEEQVLEVLQKSFELKVKHLQLCYRFARLYVRLQILFGDGIESVPAPAGVRE